MPSQPSSRTKREKQPPTRAVPAKLQPSATHKVRGICRENVPPASRALAIPPSRPSSSPAPATQRFMPRSIPPDEQHHQPARPPGPCCRPATAAHRTVQRPSVPAPVPNRRPPAVHPRPSTNHGESGPRLRPGPQVPHPVLVRGNSTPSHTVVVAEQAGPEIF